MNIITFKELKQILYESTKNESIEKFKAFQIEEPAESHYVDNLIKNKYPNMIFDLKSLDIDEYISESNNDFNYFAKGFDNFIFDLNRKINTSVNDERFKEILEDNDIQGSIKEWQKNFKFFDFKYVKYNYNTSLVKAYSIHKNKEFDFYNFIDDHQNNFLIIYPVEDYSRSDVINASNLIKYGPSEWFIKGDYIVLDDAFDYEEIINSLASIKKLKPEQIELKMFNEYSEDELQEEIIKYDDK